MEERAWDAVAAAIQDGDIEAAVAVLEPLGEAERGRLVARARRATERFGDEDRRMPYPPVWPPKKRTARALTAEAATRAGRASGDPRRRDGLPRPLLHARSLRGR